MIEEPFGPAYPDLGAGMTKYRRAAREGLSALSKAYRQEYGTAVERAILAKQRSELQRELPTHRCHCASGTNHNTGAAIHAAMKAKQRAALLAAPAAIRRAREPHVWQEMYLEAMAEKAEAQKRQHQRKAA